MNQTPWQRERQYRWDKPSRPPNPWLQGFVFGLIIGAFIGLVF